MKVKELLQKKPYTSVGYCFIVVNGWIYFRKFREKKQVADYIYSD